MDIHYIVHCSCLSLKKKKNLNPKNHLMKENVLWTTPGLVVEDG